MGPSRAPFWVKMGETSLGNHLGAAKSRSRGLFSAPRAVQEGSKRTPRPLQELKRLKDGSKTPPGADFNLSGTLRDLKIMIFGGPKVAFFGSLEHSARHKSIPGYSETSLLCQEFSKIFQDKLPRASLLERNPRSLQERIPRRARACLEGWAAVPRRRRLGLNPPSHLSACSGGRDGVLNGQAQRS